MNAIAQANVVAVVSLPAENRSIAFTISCSSRGKSKPRAAVVPQAAVVHLNFRAGSTFSSSLNCVAQTLG